MKVIVFFTAVLLRVFSAQGGQFSLEEFSPHLPTNAPIIWQAPINHLPKSLWIYKRLPPRPLSATVISNAIVLASLQSKGFPKSSTNDFYITGGKPANYPGPIPVIFSITPKSATLSYFMSHPGTNLTDIPPDEVLVKRAWACAAQLGVDPAQVTQKNPTSYFNKDENYDDLTNQICGRGVFLSRRLDEVLFTDIGDDGANGGFWIEFGSHGQIRAFSLVWPDLKRDRLQQIASPEQIIACIRAYKTMTPPIGREATNYFARIKNFAKAKKLTITRITPYYSEGVYGEIPTNDEPSEIIAPFAELEAVADFGSSNMPVRLLSPILSSEAIRMTGNKSR